MYINEEKFTVKLIDGKNKRSKQGQLKKSSTKRKSSEGKKKSEDETSGQENGETGSKKKPKPVAKNKPKKKPIAPKLKPESKTTQEKVVDLWKAQEPLESPNDILETVAFFSEILFQSHKDVSVNIVHEEGAEDASVIASCTHLAGYNNYMISFYPMFFDLPLRDQLRVVLHEILHAVRTEETCIGQGELLEDVLMGESNLQALKVHCNAFTILMEKATEDLKNSIWSLLKKLYFK